MKINGISYWIKDGKCEMLNLDDGLKVLRIPAFMDNERFKKNSNCTFVSGWNDLF